MEEYTRANDKSLRFMMQFIVGILVWSFEFIEIIIFGL